MSNHLRMAMIHTILTLHQHGWSKRRIARELGVDRGAVARHLASAAGDAAKVPPGNGVAASEVGNAKAATAAAHPPPGSDAEFIDIPAASDSAEGGSKPATHPPPGSAGLGPPSDCQPYRSVIEEKVSQGLSGRRIYQDLAADHGEHGPSYDSVKRFLRHVRKTTPLPYRRMEKAPGQEGQVDFGTGAPVIGTDGRRRRTYVFRIVLSHSRKGYSEAVYHQTTEDFIACLENAFRHWGGVPRTLVIDNLRAAVKHPDWYDPQLVPRLEAFCRHYGIVILPCKPYTPRHKGKVERGIAYVKGNGLVGHRFGDLSQQNRHLQEWENGVADTRIHGTTRQQVIKVFEEAERSALLPLPSERFPFFHEALRMVQRDGHVAVAQAYYSAPPEYVGRRVWARWDAHLVKIFNHRREPIAVHARQESGRFATAEAHIHSHKISKVERGTVYLLQQAAMLGSEVAGWSQAMLQARGVEGVRVLVGLLALAKSHPGWDLNPACRIALSHQAYRLRAIRELLKAPDAVGEQTALDFLESHPIIRELHEYDALVRDALRGMEPAACAEGTP